MQAVAQRKETEKRELLAVCKSAFDILRREGPHGFDSAAERLSAAIAKAEGSAQ